MKNISFLFLLYINGNKNDVLNFLNKLEVAFCQRGKTMKI